ncbi:MAG: DUF3313 domain-containing protein [Syntrophotaleaceae bacterium]
MKRTCRLAFFLVLAILLVSCAGKTATEEATVAERSGFYTDPYPDFSPGPKDGADLRYLKPGVDFSKYNKIMLDHVLFYPTKESALNGLEADALQELANDFHQAVIKEMQDAYPLVAEPGPDVLRVRVAITDIKLAKPVANAVSTVLPVGLAVSIVKKGVTGASTGVGYASMEMEALDSMTNSRVGAAVDKHVGGKLHAFTKTGSAEEAFEYWAKRLRIYMDNVHGKNGEAAE